MTQFTTKEFKEKMRAGGVKEITEAMYNDMLESCAPVFTAWRLFCHPEVYDRKGKNSTERHLTFYQRGDKFYVRVFTVEEAKTFAEGRNAIPSGEVIKILDVHHSNKEMVEKLRTALEEADSMTYRDQSHFMREDLFNIYSAVENIEEKETEAAVYEEIKYLNWLANQHDASYIRFLQ